MALIDDLIGDLLMTQGDTQAHAILTAEFALTIQPQEQRERLRYALDAAAVLHWFDVPLLAHMLELDEAEARQRFDHLVQLPFVEEFPARNVVMRNVHETTRLAWRKRLALERPNVWHTLSARATVWFAQETASAGRIEWIYHLLSAEPNEGARRLEEMDRAWTSTAHPENRQALALALNELETSSLLEGRARVEGLLCLMEVCSSRGETANIEGVARKIEALARDIGHTSGLGRTFGVLGDVQEAEGKLEAAQGAFGEYLAISRRLAEQDPSNAGWQRELAVAHNKTGSVLQARGELEAAQAAFEEDLAIRRRLVEQDPDNAGWQRELTVTYSRIGGILQAQGKLEAAQWAFGESFAISRRLAEQDPRNADWQEGLAAAYHRIGAVLQAQGKLDAAQGAFEEDLAIGRRLADQDPSNASWQHGLAAAYHSVGAVLQAQGKLEAAQGAFRESFAIRRRLAEQDPSNASRQRLGKMPKIFISYKSQELDYALAVKHWLIDKLNADIFVDVEEVGAGEAWQEALRGALRKVRVVLFLASELSINSRHCLQELYWARRYSTPIIPLLLDLSPVALEGIKALDVELSALHALELRRGQKRTIAFEHEGRLASVQLSANALDLREIDIQAADLPWPARDRWEVRKTLSVSPYPSLEAFGVDDGGIFFGRTADAIAVLNDLDRIHQDRTPPLFIIEAASGAGKSSFLQAGLWARLLYREDTFERVAIVRPAGGSITGLTGLVEGLVDYAERKSLPRPDGLFEELQKPPLLALRSLKSWLRQSNPSQSTRTFLIGVDQGEELYTPGVDPEAGAFKSLIAQEMAEKGPSSLGLRLLFIATIRSDSMEQLQRDSILREVHPTVYGLKSIAVGDALADIVRRPTEKWSKRPENAHDRPIEVTDDLVQAIEKDMRDQPDALPLLAFALRQLFDQARASGRMDATAYVRLGGLQLGIKVEFERACADLGVTVSDPLVRELFVPHLATWDETAKAAKRLQFSLKDMNRLCSHQPRLLKLADRLVEARLLVKTKAAVEVAHEALLRQEPLASWMREAQSDLLLRDQVFGEAREWAALKESDEALAETRGLARTAGRLADAEALFGRPDFAHYSERVSTYLLACRSKWDAEVLRTRRLSAATFGPAIARSALGPAQAA